MKELYLEGLKGIWAQEASSSKESVRRAPSQILRHMRKLRHSRMTSLQ
jgi:hypothetical protein